MSYAGCLSPGPGCTMKPPLPNFSVSLDLSCQGLCVFKRPLTPSLIAEPLHSQGLSGCLSPLLKLTCSHPQASREFLLSRPRNASIHTAKSQPSFLPTTQEQTKESPTPCLGGSPARPESPQIDQPPQMVLISQQDSAQLQSMPSLGTQGVQERCCWDSQATMLCRKELPSA